MPQPPRRTRYSPQPTPVSRMPRRAQTAPRAPQRPAKLLGFIPIPHFGRWFTLFGLVGIFGGTLALAIVVAVTLRAVFVGEPPEFINATPNATPNPTFLAPTLDLGTLPQWQGNEPVTVLLMGADTRPSERENGYRPRTDTMILLMADPANKRASMLSIPRDLFVDIPGYGLNRVNSAYVFGGPDLSVSTVQYNLGVRVNYYAMIEFNVFVTMIDQIGGVDVDVPDAIYDASYPTYDFNTEIFSLPAGMQHLDGETALKYARTRHGNSDYDRARRQQQIIMAVRDKVLNLNMLPTLIQNAPSTYSTLRSDIDTNMTIDQMISLSTLAKDIPKESIRSGVIDENYTMSYVTPEGAQVEIPNRANIGQLLAYIFWLN
jgi:LCP family protein required for cell wall assembly